MDGKPSGDSGRRRPSDFAGVKTLKSRRGFLKNFYGSPGGPALGTSKFFALVNFPRDSEVREDRDAVYERSEAVALAVLLERLE